MFPCSKYYNSIIAASLLPILVYVAELVGIQEEWESRQDALKRQPNTKGWDHPRGHDATFLSLFFLLVATSFMKIAIKNVENGNLLTDMTGFLNLSTFTMYTSNEPG
jgi:hypothetical protein